MLERAISYLRRLIAEKRRATAIVATISGIALALLAGKAAANSEGFAFTMEKRAVHGKKNGRLHSLDAGELTLSGGIWVVSKNGSASSSPDTVEIKVRRDNFFDSEICSLSVTPSTTFNAKRSFDKSCGQVEKGSYWLDVTKPNTDGWHIKGSGTLITK